MSDFIIENGVLKKYTGNKSVVNIPEGVTTIGRAAFQEDTIVKRASLLYHLRLKIGPGTV